MGQSLSTHWSADYTWFAFRDPTQQDMVGLWDDQRQRFHGRLLGRGEVAIPPSNFCYGAHFSPDNILLATTHLRAGEPILQIDEVASRRSVKVIPGVTPILWRNDGHFLLTCGLSLTGMKDEQKEEQGERQDVAASFHYKMKSVELLFAQAWEVAAPVPTYLLQEPIEQLTFRADGRQLIVNRTLWDVKTGSDRQTLRRTGIEIPGGNPISPPGFEIPKGKLGFRGNQVWAAVSEFNSIPKKLRQSVFNRTAVGPLASASASTQGIGSLSSLVSLVGEMGIIDWEPPEVFRLVPSGPAKRVSFSHPDPANTQKLAWKFSPHEGALLKVPFVYSDKLIWQPDGKLLFANIGRGDMFLYEHDPTGRTDDYWGIGGPAHPALTVCIDTETGRLVFEHEPTFARLRWENHPSIPTMPVVFQEDGRRFVTFAPGELKLWDSKKGSPQKTFSTEKTLCWQAAWSRDARFVVATGYFDAITIGNGEAVWKNQHPYDIGKAFVFAIDGSEVHHLSATRSEWLSFTLSAEGQWVVTGGEDGLIHIRDARTGKELIRWQAHEVAVTALKFSPDGHHLVSGGRDGTLRVWNLPWIRKELGKYGLDW